MNREFLKLKLLRGCRGWSIGVMTLAEYRLTNEAWQTHKHIGSVTDALSKINSKINFKAIISHTRWATHGEVNLANTHPHISYDEEISLVHNGVIENFKEIKDFLESKQIKQVSETDSEVICNLIAYQLNQIFNFKRNTILEALQISLMQLKGSYAIAFICRSLPDKIFYAKKGSPLVLGGQKTAITFLVIFILLLTTDQVLYLNDGDYGYIESGNVSRFNLKTPKERELNWTKVSSTYQDADLGNHQHYMIKEICEQKDIVQKLLMSSQLKIF